MLGLLFIIPNCIHFPFISRGPYNYLVIPSDCRTSCLMHIKHTHANVVRLNPLLWGTGLAVIL